MKQSIVILSLFLSVLLIYNSLRVSLTYAYYELDPIGFIEKLCVNQDQPELECNGKCHLKKVAQSQDKKQKTPESTIDFVKMFLYTNNTEKNDFSIVLFERKKDPIIYLNTYSFTNSDDCFHPPRT